MSEETIKKQPELFALESQAKVPCYFLALTVENVRSFSSSQRLDLSDGQGRPARWVILLGDNGAGKTTLLQCLAAMIPCQSQPQLGSSNNTIYVPEVFIDLANDIKYRSFLRVDSKEFKMISNFAVGSKLDVKDGVFHQHEVSVSISPHSRGTAKRFLSQMSQFVVYGYGAARRIGNTALSESRDGDPRSTLFDENSTLLNAEEWLLQADYSAVKSNDQKAAWKRDRIKDILIRLLPEVDDLRIQTGNAQTAFVEAFTPYGWVTVRSLSSGYRSVIAWMVDLASRLFDRYPDSPDPLAEPAVVLVDQIDLLLHPKWQRELVQTLTSIFRNTQFIVTAHSPLIVQAATDAKIVLLRREKDHVVIDNRAESVRGWRLDQIVSSDLFDNVGTRDPETEALLQKRKTILTKPSLSADDKNELHKLDEEIGSLRFGGNADETRAMEIIERAAKKLEAQKL